MCDVIRAPFWPSGSLAICTMISWPSFNSSEIEGAAVRSGRLTMRCGSGRDMAGSADPDPPASPRPSCLESWNPPPRILRRMRRGWRCE